MPDLSTIEKPNSRFLDRAGLGGFPWFTALALYTISYGWFWNIRNSYWSDDWWAFYEPGYLKIWRDLGMAPWFEFYKWLYELIGPGFMRLITFVVFFLSAVCFFGISKKIPYLKEQHQKFATLLFLLLPFESARGALMTFHYSVAYFWFFLAWYLIITSKLVQIKVLAAFLFFISFQMHSLPVFFALPILHLFSLEKIRDWRLLIVWMQRNLFLIILPPLYWTLRWLFWNTTMSGYHDPSLPQLLLLSKILVVPSLIVVLILALARFQFASARGNLYLAAISLSAIFLGLTPYIIFGAFHGPVALRQGIGLTAGYWVYFVGRSSWWSRMLFLQPLGAALLICCFLNFIPRKLKNFEQSLRILIVSICVVLNLGFGLEYLVDYAKQREIISEFQSVGHKTALTDYEFIDKTIYLNVRGRDYSNEWRYLIDIAYGSKIAGNVTSSTQCRSSGDARLVVIDGEASYWNAFQSWFKRGNFGFSVEVLDGPTPCTPDLVENRGRQNQIPFVFYFIDAEK